MTSPLSPSNANNNRQNWWQQTIVRRTVSFVENDMEHVMQSAPFLRNTKPNNQIAVFHRSEIQTGKTLGRGGFSVVKEVTGFELNPQVSQQLTPQQQEARRLCVQQCYTSSGGSHRPRYALKHLQERLLRQKNNSANKDFQFAAADLAVEAAYLSRLCHPHILAARGLPVQGVQAFGDGQHDGYFILSDRLDETLDQRIQSWQQEQQDETIHQKSVYAVQLASALEYLHQHRIVFRDLKSPNIGFNDSNQVQLFDFGLCRELPSASTENCNDVYEMSGVGTRRYMATEVVKDRLYNCKADVYSWSMILWEMLTLEKPYADYGVEEHGQYVCRDGERPAIWETWPAWIRNLLPQVWTANVERRLSMKEVVCLLRSIVASQKVLSEPPDSPVSTTVSDLDLFSWSSSTQQRVDQQLGRRPSFLSLPVISGDWSQDNDLSEASDIISLLDCSVLGLTVTSSKSFDGMEVTMEPVERSCTV